jgi:hypothetical protein
LATWKVGYVASALQVEAGTVGEPGPLQVGHQHHGLGHNPQGRANSEQPHLLIGEGGVGGGLGAPDRQVEAEHPDRDQVVDDRCPHHRAELLPGVQHLADQEEDAEEEQLRHRQIGHHQQRAPMVGQAGCLPTGGIDAHHHLSADGEQHRDRTQNDQKAGDDPIDEGFAAVLIVVHRPDDLWHQHVVQGATGQQHVERVRHEHGQVEHLYPKAGVTKDEDQQHGPHQAEYSRNHRARSHHCRGAEQTAPAGGRNRLRFLKGRG